MPRTPTRAGAVAVLLLTLVAIAPAARPAPVSAAGECGTYASESVPPPTIRVFRIVVSVTHSPAGPLVEVAAGEPDRQEPATEPEPLIDRLRDHPVVLFEAAVDAAEARRSASRVATPRFAVRLLVIQLVLERSVASMPARRAFGS